MTGRLTLQSLLSRGPGGQTSPFLSLWQQNPNGHMAFFPRVCLSLCLISPFYKDTVIVVGATLMTSS